MYKLILQAFPHHFKDNSIYAHFPFVIPDENRLIQRSLKREGKYSWEKPTPAPQLVVIKSYTRIKKILNDLENWKYIGGHDISYPTSLSGIELFLSGESLANDSPISMLKRKISCNDIEKEVRKFFQETTEKLLDDHRFKIPGENGYEVDIVRDISNLVNARYAAHIFNLPINTGESPSENLTDRELYQTLALLHYSIAYNADVSKSLGIRQAAEKATKHLGEHILTNTKSINHPGLLAEILSKLFEGPPLRSYATSLVKGILDSKVPIDEVVSNCM